LPELRDAESVGGGAFWAAFCTGVSVLAGVLVAANCPPPTAVVVATGAASSETGPDDG
jgi:hypothetical protein